MMKTDQAFHFITSFNDLVVLFLFSASRFPHRMYTFLSIFPFCVEKAKTKNENTFYTEGRKPYIVCTLFHVRYVGSQTRFNFELWEEGTS